MRIAIIGCGNMGTALAEQLGSFHQVFLHDRDWTRAQALAKKIQAKAYQEALEAAEKAHIILLAVKPQNLKELAYLIGTQLRPDQIVVSLLAGTPLEVLRHYFLKPILVRMMPNLAIRYGKGVVGIVDSPDLSPELKKELQELFTPLGFVYWLKESQMDALTSLTGSGPAFMFALIEAMTEAGITMGFQAQDAQHLVLHMLEGCLTLLQETKLHPAELKWQIASPSGTTITGLRVLEKENVRSGVIETFLAAHQRAQELAKSHEIKEEK